MIKFEIYTIIQLKLSFSYTSTLKMAKPFDSTSVSNLAKLNISLFSHNNLLTNYETKRTGVCPYIYYFTKRTVKLQSVEYYTSLNKVRIIIIIAVFHNRRVIVHVIRWLEDHI